MSDGLLAREGNTVIEPLADARRNLSEAAAEQLVGLVETGQYEPGARLPSERELMEALNIGRSTVREAVQRLTTIGLVEVRPGVGTFVSEAGPRAILDSSLRALLSTDEVTTDLMEARTIIEPHIAMLAAQRATEEDVARVQDVLDATRQAVEQGKPAFEYSARYHEVLAECTHNAVLVRFMGSIMDLLVERGREVDAVEGYSSRELEEHQSIVDLVASGDAEGASAAVREHIEWSTLLYIDTVRKP